MKILGSVISEDLFLNAFHICRKYCEESRYIHDVNFRLLKTSLLALTEEEVSQYYKKYIATDLVYSVCELFSSDIVSIPKRLTGVREYRFFSTFSMILYNAIGLVFIDCCDQVIRQLNFKRKNVFSYYPTKFNQNDDRWNAKNDYKTEYNAFISRINTLVEPNDIILKIDITNYFETIPHSNLVDLLRKFSTRSSLEKHQISNDSYGVFEFYLESVMQRKHGIPQGKKNFVSDYFGYIYLIPFDISIPDLAASKHLTFKCLIRYVDDILIVCNMTEEVPKEVVFRELLTIEQGISSWLYNNYGLNVNTDKTVREIIGTRKKKNDFLQEISKTVSSPRSGKKNKDKEKKSSDNGINEQYKRFKTALAKFRFPKTNRFNFDLKPKDIEDLKLIMLNSLQGYVLKKENIDELKKVLESIEFDLASSQITIIIALFYLEQKKGKSPFNKHLSKFVTEKIDFSDKRHLHIIFAMLVQSNLPKKLLNLINESNETLSADNYGKYLLTLLNLSDHASDDSIYRRINSEFKECTLNNNFLYSPLNIYESIIDNLASNFSDRQTLVQPLKQYTYERWNERWDIAFNHFYNFFHELCKVRFSLGDSFTVNHIISKMNEINTNEELIILKFYDCRNFNAVSHPSQKGQPSVKVSKYDLERYEEDILSIIVNHLID